MMLEQYFEVDAKRYGYFSGLVIGTAVIVTTIYWVIFGFDTWQGEMQHASDLMMAASVVPLGQANTLSTPAGTGQYVCPRDGAVGLPNFDVTGVAHCPVCGQAMAFYSTPPNGFTLVRGAG